MGSSRKPHLHAILGLTHLDAAVAPVSHDDVPVGVHSYSRGSVELPVALTMGAELEEELSVGTVHLAGQRLGTGHLASDRGQGLGGGWGEAPGLRIPRSAATAQFFSGFPSMHPTATGHLQLMSLRHIKSSRPFSQESSSHFWVTGNIHLAMSHYRLHRLLCSTANEWTQSLIYPKSVSYIHIYITAAVVLIWIIAKIDLPASSLAQPE